MAEPLGWRALDRLADALAGMTGVRPWGGQYPSDPVVQHHHEPPRTLTAFLRIKVMGGPGSTAKTIDINSVLWESRFGATIEASIIGNDDISAQGWAQRVRHDVIGTLISNWTLGGLVSGIIGEITETLKESDTDLGQQVTLTMAAVYLFRENQVIT